jgi:hypothetical protein
MLNRPQLRGPFGPGTKPVELFLHRTLPPLYPLATQLNKVLRGNACIDINGIPIDINGIPTRRACSSLFEAFKVFNSLTLCTHTTSYASCQTSKLSRLTASLSQIQPPAPLLQIFFLRFLCGSPTYCSVVRAPIPPLIRSSPCLDPLRSLSLLHPPIFRLRTFSRPPPLPPSSFFVLFRFVFVFFVFLLPPPPTPAVLFARPL